MTAAAQTPGDRTPDVQTSGAQTPDGQAAARQTAGGGATRDRGALRVLTVSSEEQLHAAFSIRFEVFVEEQGVSADAELDAADRAPTTQHVIVVDTSVEPPEPVGTGRLLTDAEHPEALHIGRLAVRAPWRSSGVGAVLMRALETLAAERTPRGSQVRVELSAQEQAIGFYQRQGYVVDDSHRYLDENIWHRDAVKTVDGTA